MKESCQRVEVTFMDGTKRIQTGIQIITDEGDIINYVLSGTFKNGKWIVDPRVTCEPVDREKLRRGK